MTEISTKTAALLLRMMLGAPYRMIARALAADRKMVQYWTDPDYRARRNATARAYYAETGNVKRKRVRDARTPAQREREKLRALARAEAKERNVAVQPIYEQWGCQ